MCQQVADRHSPQSPLMRELTYRVLSGKDLRTAAVRSNAAEIELKAIVRRAVEIICKNARSILPRRINGLRTLRTLMDLTSDAGRKSSQVIRAGPPGRGSLVERVVPGFRFAPSGTSGRTRALMQDRPRTTEARMLHCSSHCSFRRLA